MSDLPSAVASSAPTPESPIYASQLLQPNQLPVGQPLPFALVDLHGAPLLAAGSILPNDAARDVLFAHFSVYRAADSVVELPDEPTPLSLPNAANTSALRLEDMNLEIGAKLRVRPPAQTGFGVVISHLIGFAPNQSLFVTRPRNPDHDIRLMFGERLEILHIARRAVFDFVCTVDAVCKMPFEFLVLSGPANIRRLRARNAMRMNQVRPVLYRTGVSDLPVLPGLCTGMAIMQELSAQGVSVLAPEPLAEVGEHLRVAFQVLAEGETLDIDVAVVVRNLRLPHHRAGMIHGLEFKGLDASTQLALRCMVLEQAVL
jgi:hypothetical protein